MCEFVVERDRLQLFCPEVELVLVATLKGDLARLRDDVDVERLGEDFDAVLECHDACTLIGLTVRYLETFETLRGAGEKHHVTFLQRYAREKEKKYEQREQEIPFHTGSEEKKKKKIFPILSQHCCAVMMKRRKIQGEFCRSSENFRRNSDSNLTHCGSPF